MNSGIYKILNLVDGNFYVGSAVNLKKRKREHWYFLKKNNHSNKHLQNAWNKYGAENFRFDIIEETLADENILLLREQNYLDILKPKYNICLEAGTTRGRIFSKKTKEKIGKKAKERLKISPRIGINAPNYGKLHTEEYKVFLSKKLSGENNPSAKLNWERIHDIRNKYATGDFTQKQLAIENNIHQTIISEIVRNKLWRENV